MLRRLLVALVLLPHGALPAQGTEPSAVVDLLDRMTADINDLRYAEALATGRALAARAAGLAVPLRTRLRLLLAAAYFPEDAALQRADSAVVQLKAAVEDAPDAAYPAELRWRGLDSLLAHARSTTVSAVLRPPARQPVAGPGAEARFPFVATPGTTVELRVQRAGDEAVLLADTLVAESGAFRLAAHDGSRMLLAAGAYRLVLTARRGSDPAVSRSYAASVEAPPLALEPLPELEPGALLPEVARPDGRRVRRLGAIAAAATIATALFARTDADLRSAYGPDPRAAVAGAAIVGGTLWFAGSRELTPIPRNVAANAATRAAHARTLIATQERNAAALAAWAGTIVMGPDAP